MQCCKTVTLRFRDRTNGTKSLFLDFYPGYRDPKTLELKRRKKLGLYIYSKPKDSLQKEYNKTILDKAEAIRCRIYMDVINERYDFFCEDRMNESFIEYFKEQLTHNVAKRDAAYKQFAKFIDFKCTFADLDLGLCRKFKEYLLGNKTGANGVKAGLSRNSASAYWNVFRSILKQAYSEKMLKDDLSHALDSISCTPTNKNSLTLTELRKLYATPCHIAAMKKAIIFSCLSGLRLSDILNLKWENIRSYADGGKYLDFICVKTKRQTIVPISDEAVEVIQPQQGIYVFQGFKRNMVNTIMHDWLKEEVGLTKHITFHCFRHTYATLQLELGTDIYTVQHLLSHKNVSTTQIYLSHADPKSREAASRIKLTDVKSEENKENQKDTDIEGNI